MKMLRCRDLLPRRDCEWELIGTDDDDVIRRAREHCRSMHGYQLTAEDEQRARGLVHEWIAGEQPSAP